jgi:hypothetical protein
LLLFQLPGVIYFADSLLVLDSSSFHAVSLA